MTIRFAVFLRSKGVAKGDVIHLLLGNSHLTFGACFGAWILGAVPSSGNCNVDHETVAGQVGIKSINHTAS